jgi:hypothetical protein
MPGGRAGVFNRVPTLCNQLLPYLLADILQTLQFSCYGHFEDVHVTFWKCLDHFTIMDKCVLEQPGPFYSWIDFSKIVWRRTIVPGETEIYMKA